MKNAMIGSVFLLTLGGALSRAEASSLYTTTDLGSSYQLLAGARGNDYGVTGAARRHLRLRQGSGYAD